MRILYDNILKYYDSMIATNQSDNRPVTNIIHNFLELPFQATGNNSDITIELDKDYSVKCIAYGFNNMSEFRITFYDIFDAIIDSFVFADYSPLGAPVSGEDTFYFLVQLNNVRKIKIEAETIDSFLYIGSFFAGLYLELPNFLQAPESSIDIRDSIFESGSGQSGGNKQRNLDNFPYSFPNVDNAKKIEIKEYLNFVQRSVSHYIDAYPDAHNQQSPVYCKMISNNVTQNKKRISDFRYNIDISWRQAR